MTPSPRPIPKTKAALPASEALSSRWIALFTGLCYLCVALGFSYLDRRYGYFPVESIFWVCWAGVAFSAGAITLGSGGTSSASGKPGASSVPGNTISLVMTVFAVIFAIFPAFLMYVFLRWICVVLLLVIAARGPVMHTRRDLYLSLTTCFAVSFMAATHGSADWTLWLYLGPAWVFAGLALTWDYAADKSIGHGTRLAMNLGFVGITAGLALVFFLFLPRPPVLGFGFIPPSADAAGLSGQPAGAPAADAKGASATGQADGAGSGTLAGKAGGPGKDDSLQDKWDRMLKQMRPALQDPHMPAWQKDLLGKLLDRMQRGPTGTGTGTGAGQDKLPSDGEQTRSPASLSILPLLWKMLLALLALLLGWLLYVFRYWLGIEAMHIGARLLAWHFPERSMRLSAQAMKWCLMDQGYKPLPGQSLWEYLDGAPRLPQLARRWFSHALSLYSEMRFGTLAATTLHATRMRESVAAATQLVKGHAPELAKD